MKGIWKYSRLLPFIEEEHKVSLAEGNTPLVRSMQLGPMLGLKNLFFKLESLNPSGSYKGRFAAGAISELLRNKLSICLATSSGNTGSALAAYCAASNIKCFITVVDGAPSGKIQQMQVYGATTLMVKDFGISQEVTRDVFSGLQNTAKKHGNRVQISAYAYSPFGMSGVQTISYEIAETLLNNNAVHIFSPAGGGGLTLAIANGFKVWHEYDTAFEMPKVHCVQPNGNDTISSALREGKIEALAIPKSTTSISGLQVPNVIDGHDVIAKCRETNGTGFTVTDELIYECQKNMALKEGIFCEPAGAVSLAGVIKAMESNEVQADDHIVCIVTGHGFKDPISAAKIVDTRAGMYFNNTQDTLSFLEIQLSQNTSKLFPITQ